MLGSSVPRTDNNGRKEIIPPYSTPSDIQTAIRLRNGLTARAARISPLTLKSQVILEKVRVASMLIKDLTGSKLRRRMRSFNPL